MKPDIPLKIAIAGIGGWAAQHHRIFYQLEREGSVKVVATCDPREADLTGLKNELQFESRGISTWRDFDEMMAARVGALDLAVIASPIHQHARMHAACVDQRVACYLEKPPTLDPDELSTMIAVERAAHRHTYVGFSYINQEERRRLKQRMVSGEFGRLKSASFIGLASRPESYYRRNNWSGRLIVDDHLLLDSCCGNAMSHHLNSMLFFAGTEGLDVWALPRAVTAELYRANDIEGSDAIFASAQLDGGVELRVAAAHACEETDAFVERFSFELAELEIRDRTKLLIRFGGGKIEESVLCSSHLGENIGHYLDYLSGRTIRPAVLLKDCQSFVTFNALLYIAAGDISPIAGEDFCRIPSPSENGVARAIQAVGSAAHEFLRSGRFPSQTGFSWGKKYASDIACHLTDLRNIVRRIAGGTITNSELQPSGIGETTECIKTLRKLKES